MKNKIEDLRDHLFETIEKVKDGDMDLDRARAISGVAQTIINSAKVENDYLKITGQAKGTDFIPPATGRPALPMARGKGE
ncbi:hypothetical protein [Marinobacter sp.]|uniref:hypothetical protein n=1 Tax=Marinobacter sp. TaxID=50741 RepID=UPI0035C6B289